MFYKHVLADTVIDVPLPQNPLGTNFDKLGNVINFGANVLFYTAIGLSLIFVLIAGIKFITSAGDKVGLDSAKKTITYTIAGLVITLCFVAIVKAVQSALGTNAAIVPPF